MANPLIAEVDREVLTCLARALMELPAHLRESSHTHAAASAIRDARECMADAALLDGCLAGCSEWTGTQFRGPPVARSTPSRGAS